MARRQIKRIQLVLASFIRFVFTGERCKKTKIVWARDAAHPSAEAVAMFPLAWVWWLACTEKNSRPVWPGVRLACAAANEPTELPWNWKRLPFASTPPSSQPASQPPTRHSRGPCPPCVWKQLGVTREAKSGGGVEKTCVLLSGKDSQSRLDILAAFTAHFRLGRSAPRRPARHANVSVSCEIEQQSDICPRHDCPPPRLLLSRLFLFSYRNRFLLLGGRSVLCERGLFCRSLSNAREAELRIKPLSAPYPPFAVYFWFSRMYSSLSCHISPCNALVLPPPPLFLLLLNIHASQPSLSERQPGSVTGAPARKCPEKPRQPEDSSHDARFALFIFHRKMASIHLLQKVQFVFRQRAA